MKPTDIHNLADEANIKWDNDHVFMLISKQLTGKKHLDDMSDEEMGLIAHEIQNTPEPFTKNAHFTPENFNLKSKNEKGSPSFQFFRDNHDYGEGDFLGKVEKKLKRLSRRLKRDEHGPEAKELNKMINKVRPRRKK